MIGKLILPYALLVLSITALIIIIILLSLTKLLDAYKANKERLK
jgi:hypothetical protein